MEIYCARNSVDGKRYIGQTIRSFEKREMISKQFKGIKRLKKDQEGV